MKLETVYHWAPADRYDQIARDGLRLKEQPTTTGDPTTRMSYLCFSPDPATAWSLSAAIDWRYSEVETWDLWLARLGDGDEVHILPEFGPRIKEIRVNGPIPPDRLWYVGRRDMQGAIA